ncbi:unnamed protein product [Aphanomyces euteiches]
MDYEDRFFSFFRKLIEKKTKTLCISHMQDISFCTYWTILKPMLEKSSIEVLKMDYCHPTVPEMLFMAQVLHKMSTLQEITISNIFPFDGVKALLAAAPPLLKRVHLRLYNHSKSPHYTPDEWHALQIQAHERSIQLTQTNA